MVTDDQDFVRAMYYLIPQESLVGPVNLSAPNPLPYTEFIRAIRRAERVPWGMPSTRGMLEIGALLLQTETELILKSRRVVPGRLLQEGFLFQFPHWSAAAGDLCQRWHEQQNRKEHRERFAS